MKLAEVSGNTSAYAQAAMNKAKLLGHVTDKAEVRTGQLDPEEAKPDISSIWARAIAKAEDQSATATITH
jgi:hypothetical protein